MTLAKPYLMNMLPKLVVPIFFSLAVVGCANTYQPIHKHSLNDYKAATIVMNVPQQEISLQVDGADFTFANLGLYLGGVGGLAVALAVDAGIGAIIHNKAEARVAKFREALKEEPTPALINNQIQNQLAIIPWVSNIDFVQHYLPQQEFRKKIESSLYSGDVLIVVETKYSFTSNFETIVMQASYSVHAKKPDADINELQSNDSYFKPFYKNFVVFQSEVFSAQETRPFTEGERDEARKYLEEAYQPILAEVKNRRRRTALLVEKAWRMDSIYDIRVPIDGANIDGSKWLQENAVVAKNTLKEGANEIARLIKLALNGNEYSSVEFPPIGYGGFTVQVIDRDEDNAREIFRVVGGGFAGVLVSKRVGNGYFPIPRIY